MRAKCTTPGAVLAATGGQRIVSSKPNDFPSNTTPVWLQRQAHALHERGPRPLGEILLELIETFGPELRDFLRARLVACNRIPPEIYAALHADRFTPPFAVVDTGRR